MSTSKKSNKVNPSGSAVTTAEPAPAASNVYASAYAQVRDEAAAVPKERVRSYGLAATYASGVARAAVEQCEGLTPQLAELPRFDLARVKKIPAYGYALQYAQGQLASSSASTDSLPAQNERAKTLIERFESCSATLVLFGLLDPKTVAPLKVSSKRGYRISVETLIAYADVYEALLAKGASMPIRAEHVAEARALADEMTGGIGSRARSGGGRAHWIEQRKRVSALLWSAYAELRAGVAYVRRDEGDAEELTPPLNIVGAHGADASEEQEGEEPEDGEEGAQEREGDAKGDAQEGDAKGAKEKGAKEKPDDDAPHGPPGSITNPFLP